MAEEEIPENEPEQEEKQSGGISSIAEEETKEEAENESVASAGIGGEEAMEEEPEITKSGADVNIIEGESNDAEGELPAKVMDEGEEEETVPLPSSQDQEEHTIAEETEIIEEEIEGEKVEEVEEDEEEEEGREGEVEGELEVEGEGESEGEREDEAEGEAEGEYERKEEGEGEGEGQDVTEKLIGVTTPDGRGISIYLTESQLTLDPTKPRPSIDTGTQRPSIIDPDRLIFDPTFDTSRMSKLAERIQTREEFFEMTVQEEESKVTTPSEETIPEEEEEEEPPIDRQPYLELYTNLMKQRPFLKMKNNFLQRKMADYFKSRKMEHVLRESERVGDAEAKYIKKLDALWELRNVNNLQREAITEELNEMKKTRNSQLASVTMNFEQMLSREHDIGTGLIYTKTAKEIPEKFLERLLKNQRMKSKEIEEMRLAYIRIRDAVNEVQGKIKAMDKIGEQYTLIDYEQLKMENQSHADKIEERDAELEKLRAKYSADIQCLAHFREKSTNTNLEIEEMQDKFQEIEINRNNWRERVNSLKQERDALRSEILRLQENSGLLSKPKLLIDLQETMSRVDESKRELDEMKEQFAENTVMLEALKKNLEEEKDRFQLKKSNLKEQKKLAKHKSRLAYPSVERFHITEFEESLNNNK